MIKIYLIGPTDLPSIKNECLLKEKQELTYSMHLNVISKRYLPSSESPRKRFLSEYSTSPASAAAQLSPRTPSRLQPTSPQRDDDVGVGGWWRISPSQLSSHSPSSRL